MHFYQAKKISGDNKRNNKHIIFFINNSNTTKHRIYNLKMKIQIKEKWGTCHISNAKDQLKHSFSKSTINKRKVPFSQIRIKIFQSLLREN